MTTFTRCFTRQARSADPTATPPGCATPQQPPPAVRDAYRAAATTATSRTFASSFTRSLWYQVAIYLLTLALITRLPKVNPRQLAELDQASAAT